MEQIDAILSSVLEVKIENLQNEQTMDDIASWDSLRQMDLIAEIESKLKIELTFDEIAEMTSIGNIRTIISNKIA